MAGRHKLFLTKTHAALQNLKRRIENPGVSADFVSIDSLTKKVDLPDYDIIGELFGWWVKAQKPGDSEVQAVVQLM